MQAGSGEGVYIMLTYTSSGNAVFAFERESLKSGRNFCKLVQPIRIFRTLADINIPASIYLSMMTRKVQLAAFGGNL